MRNGCGWGRGDRDSHGVHLRQSLPASPRLFPSHSHDQSRHTHTPYKIGACVCLSSQTRTTDTHGHQTPCVSVSKAIPLSRRNQSTLGTLTVYLLLPSSCPTFTQPPPCRPGPLIRSMPRLGAGMAEPPPRLHRPPANRAGALVRIRQPGRHTIEPNYLLEGLSVSRVVDTTGHRHDTLLEIAAALADHAQRAIRLGTATSNLEVVINNGSKATLSVLPPVRAMRARNLKQGHSILAGYKTHTRDTHGEKQRVCLSFQ